MSSARFDLVFRLAVRKPQPTPPRLPRRATVRQRARLTTQTIVRTEITSTAANARGIGGQPADIRGIIPQSRQTMESPRPSRARNPAHPAKVSNRDETRATKAATEGMR